MSTAELILARLELAKTYEAWGCLYAVDAEQVLHQAVQQDSRRLRGQFLGALTGVSVVVKDSIDCAGLPTTGATPALVHHIVQHDAPIVQRLRQVDALLLGKTTMHELGLGVSGVNYHDHYPCVRNAIDPRYVAGGSSGGTAVAVALGIADIGLGTDTGGSIRIPASLNGVVGLRPTQAPTSQYGACYSTQGCLPLSPSLDTVGPMARDVSSLIRFDTCLQGQATDRQEFSRTVRFGLPLSLWTALHPEVESVAKHACHQLARHGIELVDVDIPDLLALARTLLFDLCMYEARPALQAYLERHGLSPALSLVQLAQRIANPEVQAVFRDYILPGFSVQAWQQSRFERQPLLLSRYLACLNRWRLDALCFPAVATLPPLWEEEMCRGMVESDGKYDSSFATLSRNAALASATGSPAVVLPAGYSKQGLPIGMELCGRPGEDSYLLQLGLLAERIWASC